uniref:mRNA export factor n=1 Tax=Sipha flava TaxID=143950 RepID=A0A2S2QJG3_9HEMI
MKSLDYVTLTSRVLCLDTPYSNGRVYVLPRVSRVVRSSVPSCSANGQRTFSGHIPSSAPRPPLFAPSPYRPKVYARTVCRLRRPLPGYMSNKMSMSSARPPPYPGIVSTSKSVMLPQPPDDSVSSMAFSPSEATQNLIVAGSWDNTVRCWELKPSGHGVPRALQSMTMPILDVCWNDQGNHVFMASCNKQVHCWDLMSNQTVQVAAHDAPVKTCHWIKAQMYNCLMTGSWDKTLKIDENTLIRSSCVLVCRRFLGCYMHNKIAELLHEIKCEYSIEIS